MINQCNFIEKICDMYKSGLSTREISEITGENYNAVRKKLILGKVSFRTRSESKKIAHKRGRGNQSGRPGKRTPDEVEVMRNGYRKYWDLNAVGFSHKADGYVEITRGENKGRGQHVVIMERHIGRRLGKGEVVHHIDGVKSNNNISNLKLMTNSEHAALHRRMAPCPRNNNGQFKKTESVSW
jgi:hypothetical protein